MSHKLCFSQSSRILSKLKGFPSVCAIKTAFVLSVIDFSISSTLILQEPTSTSTKTGIKPFWIMGFMVVGKPAATVITSSPVFKHFSPS